MVLELDKNKEVYQQGKVAWCYIKSFIFHLSPHSCQFQKETCLVYGLHDMRLIPLNSAEFTAKSTKIECIF